MRRTVLVDGGRAAGEDDALGIEGAELVGWRVERVQLAKDIALPQAARDQMRVLGSKVQDDDQLVLVQDLIHPGLHEFCSGVDAA